MSAVRRSSALLREPTASRHIPYGAHVSATVLKTYAGDYVQAYRLVGVSFESEDDETLNNWHERLNVTWRNIASPNVALWSHILRRRERATSGNLAGEGFADRLARRYQQRLAGDVR